MQSLPNSLPLMAAASGLAGDPIDVFGRAVQSRCTLDRPEGDQGGRKPLDDPRIHVVLVGDGSAAAALTSHDARFVMVASLGGSDLFVAH